MSLFVDKKSGKTFSMERGNPTADAILDRGIYEYDLIQWCQQFLKPDGVFIDAGAHMGTYSILLSPYCRTVHAFEPQKRTFDHLTAGITCNGCDNIIPHHVALGSEEGEATLTQVSKDGGGSSLMTDIDVKTGQAAIGTETVQVRTLDSFNLDNVCFIKIDVEGFELEVIKGAHNTLKRSHYPPLILEAWPDAWYAEQKRQLIEHLVSLGYRVHNISGCPNMLLASDHSASTIQTYQQAQDLSPSSKLIEWYYQRCHYHMVVRCAHTFTPEVHDFKTLSMIALATLHCGKIPQAEVLIDNIRRHPQCPESLANTLIGQLSQYLTPLPVQGRVEVDVDLPVHFNPTSTSILKVDNQYRLNVRAVNYSINGQGQYHIAHDKGVLRTRNYLVNMNEHLKLGSSVELVHPPQHETRIQGLEDIRLFDENRLVATCADVNSQSIPQMCYGEYDEQGNVTKLLPLQVGNVLQCEKNWLPHMVDGKVHLIYSWHPFVVYELNTDSGALNKIHESRGEKNLSAFRGSAPPIPYKDRWLVVVHEVFEHAPRTYVHRFVLMDSDYKNLKYSRPFKFIRTGIEYCLSICDTGENLLISHSLWDNASFISRVTYDTVDELF